MNQKDIWNSLAEAWTTYLNKGADPNREQILLPCLNSLIGNVKNKSILDLGCGEGSLCRYLSKKGAKVTGVDIAEKLIEIAKKETEERLEIQYVVGAAEEINEIFKDKRFDICIANLSLICIENIELVIRGVSKILKPNGIFLISVHHPCFPLRILELNEGIVYDGLFNNPEKIEWPQSSYFNRKKVTRKIAPYFPVASNIYIRQIEEYIQTLSRNNFLISEIREPKPTKKILKTKKLKSSDKYPLFPFFLFIKAHLIRERKNSFDLQGFLLQEILKFRDERNWGQFQTIKNNAISVSLESAELLEHFHWQNSEEDIKKYVGLNKKMIEDEIADIYINLLLLSHDLDIDIDKAAIFKIGKLDDKYPKVKYYNEAAQTSQKKRTVKRHRLE